MLDYIEQTKRYWKVAGDFPTNKEEVYPEHGKAHNFDGHTGQVCLEYGCGAGSDTLSMLRRGNYVHFVDITPENVEITRTNVHNAGFDEHASGYLLLASDKIPLPDSSIEVINCHGVLHHVREPEPVLQEFFRILKPGGMLYLMLYSELAERFFHTQIQAAMLAKGIDRGEAFCLMMDSGGPYARAYSEEQAFLLLEDNDFEVTNVVDYCQLRGFFRTYWGRK